MRPAPCRSRSCAGTQRSPVRCDAVTVDVAPAAPKGTSISHGLAKRTRHTKDGSTTVFSTSPKFGSLWGRSGTALGGLGG